MPKRIGPRMLEAVEYVSNHPGCPILPVAEHVGPYGSRQFGYRTVHRAVKAGLIRNVKKGNRYYCYVTEKGAEALG